MAIKDAVPIVASPVIVTGVQCNFKKGQLNFLNIF